MRLGLAWSREDNASSIIIERSNVDNFEQRLYDLVDNAVLQVVCFHRFIYIVEKIYEIIHSESGSQTTPWQLLQEFVGVSGYEPGYRLRLDNCRNDNLLYTSFELFHPSIIDDALESLRFVPNYRDK